jgi:C_GCAxxG_C_C family probable redox protein
MSEKADAAVEAFRQGRNCAQAVLTTFCEDSDLDKVTATRLATGLGGGIGRKGEVCGAVSGAVLVLGLKYGGWRGENSAAVDETYRLAGELADRFAARNGTVRCRDLLGIEVGDPAQRAQARREGLFDRVCENAVREAVAILLELLRETDAEG